MTSYKVLGLDISKASVSCCLLSEYPTGGIANHWKKTVRQTVKNYPTFHSYVPPKRKGKWQNCWDMIRWLEEEKPDFAVMEPTGSYSKLWKAILDYCNIQVLWVGHVELKRYREQKASRGHAKNDALDALCMASYPFDPENLTEDGLLNLDKFLRQIPDEIRQLRDLSLQLIHLDRVKSPIVNYTRQRLSSEFPERAFSDSRSEKYASPLWSFLSGDHTQASKAGLTRVENDYQDSIAPHVGVGIDPFTRLHAKWMLEIDEFEKLVETQMIQMISQPDYEKYRRSLEPFGFGTRMEALLIGYIYPFESFLLNGKPWRGHEYREVQKKQRQFKEGKMVVTFEPGDIKRIHKDYSRDAFSLYMGSGTITEFSGDQWLERNAGHQIIRNAFWKYVYHKIEPSKTHDRGMRKALKDYRDNLKSDVDRGGKTKMNGNQIQRKLAAATCNAIYRGLVNVFCRGK